MSGPWGAVLVVALVAFSLRAAGPAVLGGKDLPSTVAVLIQLLAPSLLAALVATQVFASGTALVLDARALGVAVAAIALCARVPLPVTLVLAAAATAVARLL